MFYSSILHFFIVLLRYNGYITVCNFKVYSLVTWNMYILKMITTKKFINVH